MKNENKTFKAFPLTEEMKKFIGEKFVYDEDGAFIWGQHSDGTFQKIADIRGYGAISSKFKYDDEKAQKFQDSIGEWIVGVLNNALEQPLPSKTANISDYEDAAIEYLQTAYPSESESFRAKIEAAVKYGFNAAQSSSSLQPSTVGGKERPNIKQFFGEDATLETVHNSYINAKELFSYAQALDSYIDEIESSPAVSLPKLEEGIWEDFYNEIDSLARDIDSYDFGLPMLKDSADSIINKLKEKYVLGLYSHKQQH